MRAVRKLALWDGLGRRLRARGFSFLAAGLAVSPLPIDFTLATTKCVAPRSEEVEFRLALQSGSTPGQAEAAGQGWKRRIVLEVAARDSAAGSVHLWEMEDVLERVTSPPAMVYGALACKETAAQRDLSLVLLVSKTDPLQYWNEVWILDLSFSSDSRAAHVLWTKHIPRLPLPRGYTVTEPYLLPFGNSGVVAVLGGWGSGLAPAMLQINLPRRKIWLLPPEAPVDLEILTRPPHSEPRADESKLGPDEKWFACSSLKDCAALRDYCGNWTGVRGDKVEAFQEWTRGQVMDCAAYRELRMPDQAPSLLCEQERCTIRWVTDEHFGELRP